MSETPTSTPSETPKYLKGAGRDEVTRFMNEVQGESDRACIVIAAIVLEVGLEKLLKRKLLPNPSRNDDLFDQMKPLGAFSPKIDMAYRLGLVPAEGAKALHLVRKIRNHVAHNLNEASFQSGSNQDRVNEAIQTLALGRMLRESTEVIEDLEDTVRARFEVLVGWMLAALEETEVAVVDGSEVEGVMWKSFLGTVKP